MDSILPRRFVPGERACRRVLLAVDSVTGPVAVKLSESAQPEAVRDLARETERLASLRHPAFPRVVSFGRLADGRAWLAMERASGEVPTGPMEWADLAKLADGLCEALACLHARRLLHRDLKTDHVRFDAGTGRVMVLDLGSAGCPGPARRGGSAGYVAPEIAAGRGADERSDLHSLGAVLYEAATGSPAFTGAAADRLRAQREGRFTAMTTLRPDTPARFADLVSRLLSPDPLERPAGAEACRAAIAEALDAQPGATRGEPPMMGREHELEALLDLADKARTLPTCVTLAGPRGSGRTTMIEALRCRLLLRGTSVVSWSAAGRGDLDALDREIELATDGVEQPLAILVDDAERASSSVRAELAARAAALRAGLLVVADAPRGESLGTPLPCRVDLGPLSETAVRAVLAAALRREPQEELAVRALGTLRQPGDVLAAIHSRSSSAAGLASTVSTDTLSDPRDLAKQGRLAEAAAGWQALHDALPPQMDGERAHALAQLGHALWAMAEAADALARAESALALAEACGDAESESEAAVVLGRIFGSFGSTRDAVGWQRRALDVAARRDGREDVPRHAALTELGSLMIREGHVEASLRTLTEALREADSRRDAAGSAIARARLGRARLVAGDLGAACKLLRRALAEARASGDCLAIIEAGRLLGSACCACGDAAAGEALLASALALAQERGIQQELPALHEALAQAHLRRAIRLRTPSGAIVDRQGLEVARAHVEKGIDLALATGRMADRAALAVLAARCKLLLNDPRAALVGAEEAHVLALEAGDLLVASQARLVKSEALLDGREFGVALAEARIACEAFERSADVEDAWRSHALLARIHGAWGMATRQAEETRIAVALLRKLEASIDDRAARRAYLGDVERAAALSPPMTSDAGKARRGLAPELVGSRFTGRADTEDLVEALIAARRRTADLERRARSARAAARDARARRDALLRAATLGSSARSKDVERVLDLVSRACSGARVLLATTSSGSSGRLRIRGVAGARGVSDASAHEAALVVARRVVETGRGSLALGAVGHRRSDPSAGDVHVALPLEGPGGTHGALVVRPCGGHALRRADVRLLRAVVATLSRALAPAETAEAMTSIE